VLRPRGTDMLVAVTNGPNISIERYDTRGVAEPVHVDDISASAVWDLAADGSLLFSRARDLLLRGPDGGERILARGTGRAEARFSPDATWLEYVSNEAGRPQVNVRDVAGTAERVTLSADASGGLSWSSDGRQVYFRTYDGGVWSASASGAAAGRKF